MIFLDRQTQLVTSRKLPAYWDLPLSQTRGVREKLKQKMRSITGMLSCWKPEHIGGVPASAATLDAIRDELNRPSS
jgi:hypothetical protein